jgi:hypothetical protein
MIAPVAFGWYNKKVKGSEVFVPELLLMKIEIDFISPE